MELIKFESLIILGRILGRIKRSFGRFIFLCEYVVRFSLNGLNSTLVGKMFVKVVVIFGGRRRSIAGVEGVKALFAISGECGETPEMLAPSFIPNQIQIQIKKKKRH